MDSIPPFVGLETWIVAVREIAFAEFSVNWPIVPLVSPIVPELNSHWELSYALYPVPGLDSDPIPAVGEIRLESSEETSFLRA